MFKILLSGLLLLFVTLPASAALNVFACEPEWASLTQELGQDKVKVFSATTAQQDPHRIQARPSLIAKMRRADLVICTGADLEIGWLPVLQRRANNPKVQPGQPGYFEAAQHVSLLDKPVRIDRAEGDIHAAGDPHIHLNPHNISRIAAALTETLVKIDPANADAYKQNSDNFLHRWQQAIELWEQQAKSLRDLRMVTQHKSWAYLLDWLTMQEVARLEPKPGIPPSPGHVLRLTETMKREKIKVVLAANYFDQAKVKRVTEMTEAMPVVVALATYGQKDMNTYFDMYDVWIRELVKALAEG